MCIRTQDTKLCNLGDYRAVGIPEEEWVLDWISSNYSHNNTDLMDQDAVCYLWGYHYAVSCKFQAHPIAVIQDTGVGEAAS